MITRFTAGLVAAVALAGACTPNPGTCNFETDCPGTDNACFTRVCLDHVCTPTIPAAGTPIAANTTGDCHVLQCDGAGAVVDTIDNSDIDEDGNPCTVDTCTNGVPGRGLAVANTTCGAGLVCDADAHCLGCLNWTQCPGHDDECVTRTCSQDGTCGFSYAMAGKTRTVQISKDCHKIVCDGSGGSNTIVDDTDKPIDSNPCTDDVCTAGAISHPFTAPGTTCGNGLVCDGTGTCGP